MIGNPEISVLLKQNGFPQNLTLYDNVFSPSTGTYVRITDLNLVPPDYIKCPKLTTVLEAVRPYDYVIQKVGNRYIVDCGNIHIEHEILNTALMLLWLEKNRG